jgi:3-methyl-2-oxobutanoate hydroxymethyltransferase
MKLNAEQLRTLKGRRRIAMLTAYTTPVARCLEAAGIPVILVGDTVGMVEMGFKSTRDVTLEHMCYHIGAVRRGAPDTHIIGDLPYESDIDETIAVVSAQRLLDAGADTVKLEGPKTGIISALVNSGIPVVGHTGLTPQTAKSFAQVGRSSDDAERILKEAESIADAGAFLLVLEHIPSPLAQQITNLIDIPTIGIGAGPECDGQVLVINDAIGMGEKWPPFSRQYAYVGKEIENAARLFAEHVVERSFS